MPRYFNFRVSLQYIEPEIWRRFLLAENASFKSLHDAIQDGLGWECDHLFEFRDKGGKRTIARADFDDFDADEEVPTVGHKKICSFFTRHGKKCVYLYDFGDGWRHDVQFLGMVELPDKFKRRLIDGARACPLEDCGGVWGYGQCVRIANLSDEEIAKSEDTDILERKEWIADWDPEAFSLQAAKKGFDR